MRRPNFMLATLLYRYRIWQLVCVRQHRVKVHFIADQSPLRGALSSDGPLHHSWLLWSGLRPRCLYHYHSEWYAIVNVWCEFDDIIIYTSVEQRSHVTKITFNNGAQWERLRVPGACVSLHICLVLLSLTHLFSHASHTVWLFATSLSSLQSTGRSNVQLIHSSWASQYWICPWYYHCSW